MSETFSELNVIYALFNEYLFSEAKANIELYKSYLNRVGFKEGTLEQILTGFVKDKPIHEINEHLIFNSLDLSTPKEKELIYNRILKYKEVSPDDIGMYRSTYRSICEAELINQSNEIADFRERLEFIRNNEYKSQFSTKIKITSFDSASEFEDDPANSSGIKSTMKFINDSFPTNDYINGQLVVVCGRPGGGKSLFMMQESAYACHQNKRVHYLAAGDLRPSDFLVRMSSMINEVPLSDVYLDLPRYIETSKEYLGGRFHFSTVPAQAVTSSEYVNYMLSVIDDFDMFICDYDANLNTGVDNMYQSGGELYDLLTTISAQNKLVLVGSQPKIGYWNDDRLPLTALNESSRKQAILDKVITIGKAPESGIHCGRIGNPKNRRGTPDLYEPYIRTSCGKLLEIPHDKYQLLRNNPSKHSQTDIHFLRKEFQKVNEGQSAIQARENTELDSFITEIKD